MISPRLKRKKCSSLLGLPSKRFSFCPDDRAERCLSTFVAMVIGEDCIVVISPGEAVRGCSVQVFKCLLSSQTCITLQPTNSIVHAVSRIVRGSLIWNDWLRGHNGNALLFP